MTETLEPGLSHTDHIRVLTTDKDILFWCDEIDGVLEELSTLKGRLAELYDAIAHGDEKHRAWLKDKIDAHFALATPEAKPEVQS